MNTFKSILIIIAVFLSASFAYGEDWKLFMGPGDGHNDFYYDKSSVAESGENATVLSKNVFPEGYVLTKVEINCVKNTFQGLSKIDYDKTGKRKDEAGPMQKHSDIPRDSVLNDLKKIVCKK